MVKTNRTPTRLPRSSCGALMPAPWRTTSASAAAMSVRNQRSFLCNPCAITAATGQKPTSPILTSPGVIARITSALAVNMHQVMRSLWHRPLPAQPWQRETARRWIGAKGSPRGPKRLPARSVLLPPLPRLPRPRATTPWSCSSLFSPSLIPNELGGRQNARPGAWQQTSCCPFRARSAPVAEPVDRCAFLHRQRCAQSLSGSGLFCAARAQCATAEPVAGDGPPPVALACSGLANLQNPARQPCYPVRKHARCV